MMMVSRLLLLLVSVAAISWSQVGAKRSHGAHAHGAAKLSIALEGQRLEMEFESPAHAVLGFEHEAKSAADRKRAEAALTLLKARFNEMVMLPPAAGCTARPEKVEVHQDGSHSEVHGQFVATCARPLEGGTVRFAFTKVFPEIAEVTVHFVSDKQQSSVVVQKDRGTLTIAK